MRSDFTRIAVVLDRSGSMASCRESTIAGFNQFVKDQQAQLGHATLKLVQFDNEIETVFDQPIKDVPELTSAKFVPRGLTALLDAQGSTIEQLGKELATMSEDERPGKVIVVTLTDGGENASKDWTRDRIAQLIKQQREVFSWEFIFLGANQDAIQVAASMNIPMQAAMTYGANPQGMANTMDSVSNYTSQVRSNMARGINLQVAFTEEERSTAMGSNKANRR